jgi:photosystem II stability/assembly factor-like uncharacterized protein
VNESLVFVCGIGGSIIKSENGGETWKTLIQGNKFWSANAAFKGIDFVDHLTGIVVGENGLCQISFDGGETWKSVNGLPSVDFSDVKIYDNFAVLVGSNGTIIHLNWD